MDIDLLRKYLAIGQYGSIRKTAAVFGMSPAALSHQLSEIEQLIGQALLHRTNSHTEYTKAGSDFAQSAKLFLEQLDQSMINLRQSGAQANASLRIAVTADFISYGLANALNSINYNNPDIHIDLYDDREYEIFDGLDSGNLDIYFTFIYDEIIPPDYLSVPLLHSNTFVILKTSHPMANRTSVSLNDLNGEHFILYPRTKVLHVNEYQRNLLAESGIDYSIIESSTPQNLYSYLLPIGKGILLSPWPMTQKLTPDSIAVPLSCETVQGTYSMICKKDHGNPLLDIFIRDIISSHQKDHSYVNRLFI